MDGTIPELWWQHLLPEECGRHVTGPVEAIEVEPERESWRGGCALPRAAVTAENPLDTRLRCQVSFWLDDVSQDPALAAISAEPARGPVCPPRRHDLGNRLTETGHENRFAAERRNSTRFGRL